MINTGKTQHLEFNWTWMDTIKTVLSDESYKNIPFAEDFDYLYIKYENKKSADVLDGEYASYQRASEHTEDKVVSILREIGTKIDDIRGDYEDLKENLLITAAKIDNHALLTPDEYELIHTVVEWDLDDLENELEEDLER